MNRALVFILAGWVLLLSACAPRATPEGYNLLMNTWIGSSMDDLITKWGAPTTTTSLSGGSLLIEYSKQWQEVTQPYSYSMPVTSYGSGTVLAGGQVGFINTSQTQYLPVTLPGSVNNFGCATRIKVNPQRKIEEVNWSGNGCVSDYRSPKVEQPAVAVTENPISIDVGSSPVKGNVNAKITIIEFADFECRFSKRGHDTMNEILNTYPKETRLVFKHFPLAIHKQAEPAARAAWAAQRQGKFWEFQEVLFREQEKLSDPASADVFFSETAKKLGLNVNKFKADAASEEATSAIKVDMELATKSEVKGTPQFFINGVRVAGAYPISHFKGIIDKLL